MCIFKSKKQHEPDDHVPSQAYLDGKMPTYSKEELMEHYKYRGGIHLYYIEYPNPAFGTEAYHWWAIEGYENGIYYMEE